MRCRILNFASLASVRAPRGRHQGAYLSLGRPIGRRLVGFWISIFHKEADVAVVLCGQVKHAGLRPPTGGERHTSVPNRQA